jgi:hypothetical protein
MTWRRLAWKNSLQTSRRYIGYLLSSAVAVMVFLMFACFVDNPSVRHGLMPSDVRGILVLCQGIVVVFSVFFVFFFHAALLRMRSKEFGLLLVFGVRPRQVGWLVFAESLLLGAGALVVGGLAGLLFVRLFLLAIAALLGLPRIPFVIPGSALWQTAFWFGLLFVAEGAAIAVRVARRTPRILLIGARVRQLPPRASWGWVLLALTLLACAYTLAIRFSHAVLTNMVPILALVSAGTYLLFSQVSVLVLERLRRFEAHGPIWLVAARLIYRVRDNARVLTVITLLSAMVLTGMGAMFSLQQLNANNSLRLAPFAVQVMAQEGEAHTLPPSEVRRVLGESGLEITDEVSVPVLSANVGSRQRNQVGSQQNQAVSLTAMVVSHSGFERLRQAVLRAHPGLSRLTPDWEAPADGVAHWVVPYPYVVPEMFPDGRAEVTFGSIRVGVRIDGQRDTRVWNEQNRMDRLLVVSDATFARWRALAPSATHWSLTGFSVPDWRRSQAAVARLEQSMPPAARDLLTSTVQEYTTGLQLFSTTLFAGFFVSVLFFLACGSTLYFRLSAQREDDVRQFRSLRRIGMGKGDARRIVGMELVCLFFAPLFVALVHSAVAMVELSRLLPLGWTGWRAFALVALIYAASSSLYFFSARRVYLRQVLAEARWTEAG